MIGILKHRRMRVVRVPGQERTDKTRTTPGSLDIHLEIHRLPIP